VKRPHVLDGVVYRPSFVLGQFGRGCFDLVAADPDLLTFDIVDFRVNSLTPASSRSRTVSTMSRTDSVTFCGISSDVSVADFRYVLDIIVRTS